MTKFYAHLMNLELEAENAEEAGTTACLDITTMHILGFMGKASRLVVSDTPLEIRIKEPIQMTPSRDYDGSWPALDDALLAMKEHEEKSK